MKKSERFPDAVFRKLAATYVFASSKQFACYGGIELPLSSDSLDSKTILGLAWNF